ncbi:MAG: crossover junction endodeoxyribonuclease RuvC [Gammaproteobacteria bacterium]|nr:crossover junction endodeoxyribonuclease RuvC [Gammaproteobacteria bacterium]
MGQWTRILGIDPGSRVTGFGLIDIAGNATRYVASGCIRTGAEAMPDRLRAIFDGVHALMLEHAPHEVAIEKVFMHRNADSALKLGQARAAAICATFVQAAAVHEYAARAVKQALVGQGGAEKAQVEHMVRALLKLPDALAPDEADALAVAICHAHSRPLAGRLARLGALRVVRR